MTEEALGGEVGKKAAEILLCMMQWLSKIQNRVAQQEKKHTVFTGKFQEKKSNTNTLVQQRNTRKKLPKTVKMKEAGLTKDFVFP